MNTKWIRLVLVLGLILAIAACTPQKESTPKADAPAQQSAQDDDQDTDDHDAEAEGADDDHAEGADTDANDTMAEENTDEESVPEPAPIDAAKIYADNCAFCHGDKRQGGGGPSLLPERLTKEASEYATIITEGVPGTRMKAWKADLSPEVITALSEWILTPVE